MINVAYMRDVATVILTSLFPYQIFRVRRNHAWMVVLVFYVPITLQVSVNVHR